MSERTKPDLQVNWSRTEGAVVVRRNGAPLEDMRLAADKIISQELLKELERRGYNLKTLRFSVRKVQP